MALSIDWTRRAWRNPPRERRASRQTWPEHPCSATGPAWKAYVVFGAFVLVQVTLSTGCPCAGLAKFLTVDIGTRQDLQGRAGWTIRCHILARSKLFVLPLM